MKPVEQPFATYCFTSGTSGTPKMVIRNFSFEERRLTALVDQFAFGPDDVHLVTVPLYHSSGPGWARVFLALGGRIVLCPEGDGADMARLIRTEGVTTSLMVPPVLASLVSHPDSQDLAATSRLRFVLSGGRQLNRWLIGRAWERLGPVLHLYYGTTETGLNTLITPDELHTVPGRAGRAWEGSTLAVVDSQGHLLPPGVRGRVAIASYQLMDDYANAQPVFLDLDPGDGDGPRRFLLTGDSGVLDAQGHLELTGRTDGVSKVDETAPLDVNVFGLEYDLMDLPCVRDTVVLRVDLPTLGDALVVPFVPAPRSVSPGPAGRPGRLRRPGALPARPCAAGRVDPVQPDGQGAGRRAAGAGAPAGARGRGVRRISDRVRPPGHTAWCTSRARAAVRITIRAMSIAGFSPANGPSSCMRSRLARQTLHRPSLTGAAQFAHTSRS